MAKRYSGGELVMGLFLAACFVGVAVVGLRYAKLELFWKKRKEMFVVFESVGSLRQDAPVRYNGVEKGRVKSLRPVHLDAALLENRFPALQVKDMDNLPIRSSATKRELAELPPEQFDKACRAAMLNATMIELCLEVLDEDDPIQYHRSDVIRIDSTVFGDSAIEIVSGSGEKGAPPVRARDYAIGNAGDFIANLSKSMSSMKKILTNVKEVVGTEERLSIGKAQKRYGPVNTTMTNLMKTASERSTVTIKKFADLAQNAKDRLTRTGKVLEGLVPAAESATRSVQVALKDVQSKTLAVKVDAQDAMTELSKEIVEARDALKEPIEQIREGLNGTYAGLLKAKADLEKAPARIDSAMDAAGSMQSQSSADFQRAADAGKKIVLNLKITAFMAKEHKDWMIGNRDAGEYVGQSALDIRRKLAMASRRMTQAAADLTDAMAFIQNDPAIEPIIDPVIARADNAVKQIQAVRDPLDVEIMKMEQTMYPPWNLRKRAAWRGDGLVRW